jgi:prephenate dehydrogenase
MEKVAIVGFGRFGQTLYRLLKDNFEIIVVTRKNPSDVGKAKTVFYCVLISAFETVIKTHRRFFKDNYLLIGVLSVKVHSVKVLTKYLQGLRVIELTLQQHDRLAAYSQGATHFIGRILQRMKFAPTPIDTLGAKK